MAGASLLRSSTALSVPVHQTNPTLNFSLAKAGSGSHHQTPNVWAVLGAPADTWELAAQSQVSVNPGQSPDGLNLVTLVVKIGRHRPRAVLTSAVSAPELVAALGLRLGASDVVKPSRHGQLISGMRFKVIRVRHTVETVTETLPYATLIQYSKDLDVGETKLVTVGASGKIERTYRITFRNGRETSRLVLDEQMLTEPVDEVFLTGNQNTEHGSQIGQASWYDFCKIEGDYAAHLTLPFGTVVTVRNLDNDETVTVVINDRGPYGVPGRIIDLCDSAFAQIAPLGKGVADVEITW
jgi:rare lipoprotein A (peptidoglycan hydrolase)